MDELAAIELAMNRIRRSQTRHSLAKRAGIQNVDVVVLGVVDAVDQGPVAGADEVSVREVADRLGIDPSRGSRLASAAIEAGWVRRVASQADGRRTGLVLTDSGVELVEEAHRTRQRHYDELMTEWPAEDRAEFARLLLRFTESLESS
ncbi:MarR family winged helix-turn-helix transcriptional regulator [Actinocrispum wychmicini]|uniref:DNA-binding MarR family transcriptional regulator n=1 Tax=Actinocrispum wychmicini TaxID=1213861 RepID=A0A4R2JX90_9PSEU|nr:MarR family transcriptional regulator [Actinocrispum wychmicini]TCO65171.1 DNA-binding MarR family transcriptional regulator [Actinocrispum wychmicini]